jgi:hypothetical protein
MYLSDVFSSSRVSISLWHEVATTFEQLDDADRWRPALMGKVAAGDGLTEPLLLNN